MKRIKRMIERSQKNSRKAIESFTTTEQALQKENEEIFKTIKGISVEKQELEALERNAVELYSENKGIIERIGEIVRGSKGDR